LNEFSGENTTAPAADTAVRALDIVQVESPYTHLINHLLKNVYITDSDNFTEVNKSITSINPGAHLITADGKVIRTGKVLSGGSVGVMKGNR
ncbi:MAG TPA: hypothetical protein DHW15_03680, partial [Bacteroidetes bacterium]|nr:hypothetical protein [Bacteroidota bacterium]